MSPTPASWKAIEKVKSTDKVIAAMAGQSFKTPSGITAMLDEKNHHLRKSVFIGEVKADSQFNVVRKTPGPVNARPWKAVQKEWELRFPSFAGNIHLEYFESPYAPGLSNFPTPSGVLTGRL